jgi:hypothetical protein
LVGIPHEKEPLGRTRCRCEDNIKIELGEIGLEDVDLANLFQDRDRSLVNTVTHLHVS